MKSHKDVAYYNIAECIGESYVSNKYNGIRCPVCGDEYVHYMSPIEQSSEDSYKANWEGRGNLVVIPMICESESHKFEVCIGFHKGNTSIFIRDATRPEAFRCWDNQGECEECDNAESCGECVI